MIAEDLRQAYTTAVKAPESYQPKEQAGGPNGHWRWICGWSYARTWRDFYAGQLNLTPAGVEAFFDAAEELHSGDRHWRDDLIERNQAMAARMNVADTMLWGQVTVVGESTPEGGISAAMAPSATRFSAAQPLKPASLPE